MRVPSPWRLPWADLVKAYSSCLTAASCSSGVTVWRWSGSSPYLPFNPMQQMPSTRIWGQGKGKQLEQDSKTSRRLFYPRPSWLQRELFFVARLVLNKLQYKPKGKAMWFSKWLCCTSNVLDETDGLGIDGPKVLEACKRSVHVFYGPWAHIQLNVKRWCQWVIDLRGAARSNHTAKADVPCMRVCRLNYDTSQILWLVLWGFFTAPATISYGNFSARHLNKCLSFCFPLLVVNKILR